MGLNDVQNIVTVSNRRGHPNLVSQHIFEKLLEVAEFS